MQNDEKYVSANASDGFTNKKSLNELIADGRVLIEKGKLQDKYLAEMIKEVISHDGQSN